MVLVRPFPTRRIGCTQLLSSQPVTDNRQSLASKYTHILCKPEKQCNNLVRACTGSALAVALGFVLFILTSTQPAQGEAYCNCLATPGTLSMLKTPTSSPLLSSFALQSFSSNPLTHCPRCDPHAGSTSDYRESCSKTGGIRVPRFLDTSTYDVHPNWSRCLHTRLPV